MILTQNYLSTLPVTATFARNMASHLASLNLHSIMISISTITLLLILYILIGA
jgi:hypothetical protein